jgi:hypothetical protein
MSVDSLDKSLYEFLCIMLSERLLKIQDGVVHANVRQKLLNCYPLRVFSGDQFLLFHDTSHDINAIH